MTMHPVDCPEWDYENFPNKAEILQEEIKSILIDLRNGRIDTKFSASDTRPIHFQLFRQLVPDDYPYFAGCYRGETHRCLKHYAVQIRSDPRVGFPPHKVKGWMDELSNIIEESVAALDEGMQLPNAQIPLRDKIIYIVTAACRIFELFLRIHPYANGNGHTARFCIWSLLGRYGLWPNNWPIDPRPPDPPYTSLIFKYRNGDKTPLENYIIQTLIAS